jgi:DNA-binding beta-propeller fold protein YncE
MTYRLRLAATAALAALICGPALAAAPAHPTGLHVASRIAGPDGGWDLVSFDDAHRRVLVAHAGVVIAIDADTGKANLAFAAGDRLHAVIPIPGTQLLLTTNGGDNTAHIISAADGSLVASVPTGAKPDAAIYDPASKLALVMDAGSGEITLVDVKAAKSAGTIAVGGSLEMPALDGKGRLYVNVEDKNEIAVVDLKTRATVAHYALAGCDGPTGLAYVSGGRLVSACANGVAKIIDAATGHEIASLPIGGRPDAVLYDESRHIAMIPSGLTGTLAVIALTGAGDNTVVDTIDTQIGARTGAVDPKSGRVYLPTAEYNLPVPAGQRPTTKPGTFQVLVLDR